MKLYQCEHRKTDKTVNVKAETVGEAALKGAIKLGIRWNKRKPSTVQHQSFNTWAIYAPDFNGALSLCGNVVVTEA